MTDDTRSEHQALCKARARQYLAAGDVQNAVTSMLSDLGKHPETASAGKAMGVIGLMYAVNNDADGAHRFIEGFN